MKKKAIPYEIAATTLALFGSLALAGVLMPLFDHHCGRVDGHSPTLTDYLVWLPVPIVMLIGAWYFNRKGREFRKSDAGKKH